MAERGRLDVIVHNAGHLVIGPAEAYTPEEISKVFDTNFLGAQRVNRAVLPVMRKQQQGLVLWVSSSTTRGGFPPFLGPYAAADIAYIVGLPHGTRPFRSITDFVDDGVTAVTEVAERVRREFAERLGIADLLKPGLA